jgi:hypothetical protein
MTKYYDSYTAVFNALKTDLEAVSSLKNVVLGEQFRITSLPMAVVNPEHTDIKQGAFGALLENRINFAVILMIRETEPSNWFADIVSPMGDVMDKVLNDRSLGGTVKDTTPTLFSPGEIRTGGKLYYGGVLRFQALLYFTP